MKEITNWLQEHMKETEIPDALRPEEVEKRAERIRQRRGIAWGRRAGTLAAAAVLLLLLFGIGTRFMLHQDSSTGGAMDGMAVELAESGSADSEGGELSGQTTGEDTVSGQAAVDENAKLLHSDVTYEELYRLIKNARQQTRFTKAKEFKTNGAVAESAQEDLSVSDTADYSKTDLQVDGVDEGDCVLTDGEYIYTVEIRQGEEYGCTLHILKADGKKVEESSKLELPSIQYGNMYLYQQKIILIGKKLRRTTADGKNKRSEMLDELVTAIDIIDISEREKPKKLQELTQDGDYENSRIADGYLYVFTDHYLPYYYLERLKKEEPSTYVPSVNGEVIPEGRIYNPAKRRDLSYTVMTSLDLQNPSDFSDRAAIYGGHRSFYMSQSNFYLAQEVYENVRYGNLMDYDVVGHISTGKTMITRYSYKKGRFTLEAKGNCKGFVNGSYAFHEYQGNLFVVYTKYEEKTTNGLYAFNSYLKKIGEIGNLGVDEEIYASYYIDHMAYFVTYRNTDPVFAVDIANAKKPELCSELKLPGYSDYLHSFGKDYMIGLGVHGDGKNFEKDRYKISLFHIDEQKSLSECDKEVLTDFGTDYYLLNQDHREVFVDEERKLLGFGLCDWEYASNGEESYVFYYHLYRQDGEKLESVWTKRIEMKGDQVNEDTQIRGIRIGELFYLVSVSGTVEAFEI